MTSLSRLLAITKKEVLQMRRDRLTFGMIVGIPVIQMLLFGYAINTDVRNLRTVVVDQADSHLSRELVDELRETPIAIFALSPCPVRSVGRGTGLPGQELRMGGVTIRPADRLVADADGIVVLPAWAAED